jgi:1,4-dihydroxy-2-naphthoate polyprenyltransferase
LTASAWVSTLRIRTLPAAAVPVLVGAAHSWHLAGDGHFPFRWPPAIAALVAALLIQVGTNLANDYYDHRKGADTPDRAGPRRASASGLLPPAQVRNAAFLAFLLAAAIGLYLIAVGGWPILAIGLAAILSGLLYTAGPKPLGYLGLGDLFVLIFFGPVAVMGTTYLQAGAVFWENVAIWLPALFLGLEVGALATAIIVVNNLRDLRTDARVGKRTLAVRIGERGTRIEYVLLVAFAFLLAASALRMHPEWRLALPLLSLPLAVAPLRLVLRRHDDPRALNPALGQTGLLLFAFGVLTAVGLAMP